MARKPRVEFPGAFYHVIARGNRRETLFHDAEDFAAYLTRLERYRQRDGLTCHAYVLMSNHVHVLVETGAVPLSRTMQTLQFTYTQHYNRRYGKTGHLFQGRYQAILCDREAYLLELVRYLHLNPARLRTPQDPWRYPWSSHRAYLGAATPVRVETAPVLDRFHRQIGPARQAYQRFMREGLPTGHQGCYYETVDQRFLGDERFLDAITRQTTGRHDVAVSPPRVSFPRLLAAVARATGVAAEQLVRVGRQRDLVASRAFLVYAAREWSGVTAKDLGRRLHRDPSMISRLYAQYATQRDQRLEKRLSNLLAQ
ncbi:MAG TPA: transposase [Nitrospiria bacterium]|nr:transposase [Nitrospiria bacterium]